jgi:SnoaL-like domain
VTESGIVRWEVQPLERPRRGIDERIAVAAPWLTRRLTALVLRQPAGSRLRKAALTQAVRRNNAANNRGDYRAMLATYHPDIEFSPPMRGRAGDGFDAVYRGHAGVIEFITEWKSGFGRHTYTPREIADAGGNSFALRFGLAGTIRDTDVEVPGELAVVNTLENGLLVRQVFFTAWSEALAALAATAGAVD